MKLPPPGALEPSRPGGPSRPPSPDPAAQVHRSWAGRTVDDDTRVLDGLVGWLRRLAAAADPTVGVAALARVEEAPESHERLHDLAQLLNRRAIADSGFRSDLEALVNEASAQGVDVNSITQMAWGNQPCQPPT